MKALDTLRTARGLLDLQGHKPQLYVPGSLVIHGGVMDWTEKCSGRCPHEGDLCHVYRSGLLPTGYIEDRLISPVTHPTTETSTTTGAA